MDIPRLKHLSEGDLSLESFFDIDQPMSLELTQPLLQLSFEDMEASFKGAGFKPYDGFSKMSGVNTHHLLMLTLDNELCEVVFSRTRERYSIQKKLPDHLVIEELEKKGRMELTLNGFPAFKPNRGKVTRLFSI